VTESLYLSPIKLLIEEINWNFATNLMPLHKEVINTLANRLKSNCSFLNFTILNSSKFWNLKKMYSEFDLDPQFMLLLLHINNTYKRCAS
jgi:hypothetical protein